MRPGNITSSYLPSASLTVDWLPAASRLFAVTVTPGSAACCASTT